jgi:drug/metabolite transporter (DMT)-like permease
VPLALGSAALFGASTPAAKELLGVIAPVTLAGLLYLGAGLGLLLLLLLRRLGGGAGQIAAFKKSDLPWLAGMILAGGIAGPVLLMLGLMRSEAASASLLLNLEGLATMAIAWIVFRESVDRHLLLGAGAILLGAVLLSWSGEGPKAGLGALFIFCACIAWGIDNNLTRHLSGADPVLLVAVKGWVAGLVNLAIGMSSGAALPGAGMVSMALFIGFLGYGLSIVMFVMALRHLGTARTGAYFSTAPFVGAVLAVVFLGEPVTAVLVAAALLMAAGVWLHLTERHEHEHLHEALEHMHAHIHDEHHQHAHEPSDPPGEPHVHRHVHARLLHSHPHYPDLHHRHRHRH